LKRLKVKIMEKITKAQKYAMIEDILNTVDGENVDMLIEFVQAERNALANKAAKAKAKAAEKKTEIDDLGNAVLAVMTGEPKTRDEIFEAVEFDDATVAKVGARLTKLVDAGLVQKTEVKSVTASGKKTTRMAYFVDNMTVVEVDE
jgi:hypothetical protein